MSKIGMREMLEAGAHFGHQTRRWNPKMSKFIFGPRNGIHIIDLQQTVGLLRTAYNYIAETVGSGGKILFVGTKKQAQEIIAEEAARCGQYYVNNRWLGGMLTNFKTVKQSVDRLRAIEEMAKDGTFDKLPKKEVIKLTRELAKLEKNLSGVKEMNRLPKAIFVIDPNREHIAVEEARKLGIPIIATLDTNCNPDLIDYCIPANDDSTRSIKLFVAAIADACAEGMVRHEESLAHRRANGEHKDGEAALTTDERPKKNGPRKRGPQVDVIRQVPVQAHKIGHDADAQLDLDADVEAEAVAEVEVEASEGVDSDTSGHHA
jgi:small subunit ribosomal protein S2